MSHTGAKRGRILHPDIDKGSLVERRGRKATGLRNARFIKHSKAAGLPMMNTLNMRIRKLMVGSLKYVYGYVPCIFTSTDLLRQSYLIDPLSLSIEIKW